MTKSAMRQVPAWVKPEQYQMFAVRLAAVYDNEAGSIRTLSGKIGSESMLHMSLANGGLSPKQAIDLETLLGRDLFPREFFRPDIFIPA